jgi:hypothetical protein
MNYVIELVRHFSRSSALSGALSPVLVDFSPFLPVLPSLAALTRVGMFIALSIILLFCQFYFILF